MKLKSFFIISKGLSLKQIKQIFLEGESPTLKFEILYVGKYFCILEYYIIIVCL